MKRSLLMLLFSLGFFGACAPTPELEPAPGANLAMGGDAVTSTAANVRIIADTDAWSGFPEALDEVTPVLVTIQNNSNRPLRIRYNEFVLVSAEGRRLAALPPFDIDQTEAVALTPAYPTAGFYPAPYMAGFYPGVDPFVGPFAFDPLYYGTYYPRWGDVALPTEDMLERALPEGVLEPGGRMTGFLYFEDIPEGVERLTFLADLVNAKTQDQFGVVRIPFVVT